MRKFQKLYEEIMGKSDTKNKILEAKLHMIDELELKDSLDDISSQIKGLDFKAPAAKKRLINLSKDMEDAIKLIKLIK